MERRANGTLGSPCIHTQFNLWERVSPVASRSGEIWCLYMMPILGNKKQSGKKKQ
jgi:hypothetical protein